MKVSFKGSQNEFRELVCRVLGCNHHAHKPKDRLFVLEVEGPDEPIKKGNMRVQLSKPIKPGFRRRVNLTTDEPVDVREDGKFAGIEPVEGDSTISLRQNPDGSEESTNKKIALWVNGDGTLGTGKVARVVADGHVGSGEATISIELGWDVVSPDATEFSSTVEEVGPDEAIPA